MNIGSKNKSSQLGVDCEKQDNNKWTCKFPDQNNDTKAKVTYRGSKDGDLELVKKQISSEYSDQEKQILEKAKQGVAVNAETTDDPFENRRE